MTRRTLYLHREDRLWYLCRHHVWAERSCLRTNQPKGTTCSFAQFSTHLCNFLFSDICWFTLWGISGYRHQHCIAVVAFGMKDAHYMQDIPEVPLSPDPRVTRRYDLGLNRQLPEITFFSLSEDLINDCNGKVHTMCNELGGGGGSVRYNHAVSDPHILHCHVTVYPCFLHQVKMRFRARKSVPKTLKGTFTTPLNLFTNTGFVQSKQWSS